MASLKPKAGEGTTVEGFNFVPSAVHVDHANNFSRADRYDIPDELKGYVEGSTFCFTLQEVEQRMSEYERDGVQIQSGSVYLTSTRDAFLVDGYLRHAAWLLAEVRYKRDGKVTSGTTADGKPVVDGDGEATTQELSELTQMFASCRRGVFNVFRAQKTIQPKKPEDWAVLRRRNFSENDTRLPRTPIDIAFAARRSLKLHRQDNPGEIAKVVKEMAADELGMSVRMFDRYLSLLNLSPAKQDAVHLGPKRGGISMAKALSSASKRGEGSGKGPRPGISTATARKRFAVDTKWPSGVSPRDLLVAKLICGAGVVDADEDDRMTVDGEPVPEELLDLIALLETPPPNTSGKKPPRRQKASK